MKRSAQQQGAVTLRDLAEATGFSVATVSAALNGTGRLSDQTREKVTAAARAQGYVPNLAARSLLGTRTGVIGVVVGAMSPATFEILAGIQQLCASRGLHLLISTTNRDPKTEMMNARQLTSGLVDGLVMVLPAAEPTELCELKRLDVPVVLVNQRGRQVQLNAVFGENIESSAELVAHLFAYGHRRIGYLCGNPADSGQGGERLSGFRLGMQRAGLEVVEELIFDGDFSVDAGLALADQLVKMPPAKRPTAVMCVNDASAAGLLNGLTSQGVLVPGQISVAGFDGLSHFGLPSVLTSIRHPYEQIASEALRLVTDHTDSGASQISLASEVVVRSSTGPVCRP